jgi:hypothetical protein
MAAILPRDLVRVAVATLTAPGAPAPGCDDSPVSLRALRTTRHLARASLPAHSC